jgi:hypothetical protein
LICLGILGSSTERSIIRAARSHARGKRAEFALAETVVCRCAVSQFDCGRTTDAH